MADEKAQASGTDTATLGAKRLDIESSAPVVTMETAQAEDPPTAPLSYGELKRREPGLYEFTLSRPADDPRGKVRFLELHGGRFKMEPGKSRLFRFNLPMEARTLAQLAEDGYIVEEGGPPIPEDERPKQAAALGGAIQAAWEALRREDIDPAHAEQLRQALPEMLANFKTLTGKEAPDPELADAFANRDETAPRPTEPARKAPKSRRTDETPEG